MLFDNLFLLIQSLEEKVNAVENGAAATGDAAAAAGAAENVPQGGGFTSLLWMVAIIAIFYFLMIRPQKKQQKKMEEERKAMKVGDNIVTNSGLYGKIDGIINGTDRKGNQVVESFIIKLKPEYQVRVQINKDAVYKDFNDVAATEGNK